MWQIAVALGLFAIIGVVRAPAFALTALLVLGLHSATGHKEYRFIYLALAVAPILIGVGMWLGIVMWFNVWFIIWPNQKKALNINNQYADLPQAAGSAQGVRLR